MRDQVTVGGGVLRTGYGCLPLSALTVLFVVVLFLIGVTVDQFTRLDLPTRVGLIGTLVLTLAVFIGLARMYRRSLIVVISTERLVLRRRSEHAETISRESVAMIELIRDRYGVETILVFGPGGKTLGSWDTRWFGPHFKLTRSLRGSQWPVRNVTMNGYTGEWIES